MEWSSIFMATALGAVVGTLLMAFLAKLPLAQASGMGLNYTVGAILGSMLGFTMSYGNVMLLVLISGILFLLLGMFLPETLTVALLGANIPVGILFFVACGICTSVMWGAIFNLAVEGLGKYTSIASGLFMVMVCGGGLLPLLQGFVADKAGYIPSYWVIIAALAYTLWFALAGSKVEKK